MNIERQGEEFLLRLPEQFFGMREKDVSDTVRAAVGQGLIDLNVDFGATAFIDSTGIGMLVSIARELRTRGGALVLRNESAEIRELFLDTGLDRIFSIDSGSPAPNAPVDTCAGVDIKLEINDEPAGDICVLRLGGIMNHPAGTEFFQTRFLLTMAKFRKVLLDLGELTYVDSLSVSTILKMNRLLKETGGTLRICSANFIVADLFETLNLDQVITRYESVNDALAAEWK